jgi:Tol biopolymer transport system component
MARVTPRHFLAIVIGLLVVAGAFSAIGGAVTVRKEALTAVSPGLIAFDSDRGNNTDIYVMNADGTSQTRLTTNTAYDTNPSWSPDGTKVAFVRTPAYYGNADIYLMNADGSGQSQITTSAADDTAPSWSPDSSQIAFVRTQA